MGIGSSLKKAFKDIGRGLFSPWTLLGPLGLGFAINEENKKRAVLQQAKKEEILAVNDESQKKQAAEQQFLQELETKRRGSQSSDMIFAGVLGEKGRVGLGGQKNLLGL